MNKYFNYKVRLQMAIILLLVLMTAIQASAAGFSLPDEDEEAGEGTAGKSAESSSLEIAKLAAENENLQLFIDETSGQLRIVNKQKNFEWSGVPTMDKSMSANNKAYAQALVLIRYTEGSGITQTYPSKEKAQIVTKSMDNGVRVEVDFSSLNIAFAMEYILKEDSLEVNIPFDSIKETGNKRLLTVEPLPYFGASSGEEEGAIFIPDGSGAIIQFKQDGRTHFDSYSEYIYGGDYAYLTKVNEEVTRNQRERISYAPKHYAALPVFGIYNQEKAFLAIVTAGDADAKINGVAAGERGIPLYRAATEFIYRNDDLVYIGSSGEIPMYQRELIVGERTVRYFLIDQENTNYVQLAHVYRDYLIEEKGLKPAVEQEMSFQLRLFGGLKRKEIVGNTFIAMTTFEQAEAILQKFIEQGIQAIEVTYDAWSKDGLDGHQPKHFPAASGLGGNEQLSKLTAYAKQHGIHLYLKTNYVRVSEKSNSIRPSRDAIRGLNKEVMDLYETSYITKQPYGDSPLFYLLKPERVFNKHVMKEAKLLSELGPYGIHLDYMGDTLYSDQDSNTPFSRKDTIDTWVASLDLLREKVGHTAVDYGFAYVLNHVDRIDNIPMDSSHYVYADEAVPFYQIAIHGLIPYTAKPSNLSDDPRMSFLRTLEYGAIPSFELTYEDSVLIKRSLYNNLFSTEYSKLLQPSIEEYNEVVEILNQVRDQPITNHEQLQELVYRTTFDSDLQVIVNYGQKSATVEGVTIEPFGYALLRGGDIR